METPWIWELTPEKVAEHHLGSEFLRSCCSPDSKVDSSFRLDLLLFEVLAPFARVTAVGIDRDRIRMGLFFWLETVQHILEGDLPILEHPVPGVLTSMAGVVQGDVLMIVWGFLSGSGGVSDLIQNCLGVDNRVAVRQQHALEVVGEGASITVPTWPLVEDLLKDVEIDQTPSKTVRVSRSSFLHFGHGLGSAPGFGVAHRADQHPVDVVNIWFFSNLILLPALVTNTKVASFITILPCVLTSITLVCGFE